MTIRSTSSVITSLIKSTSDLRFARCKGVSILGSPRGDFFMKRKIVQIIHFKIIGSTRI